MTAMTETPLARMGRLMIDQPLVPLVLLLFALIAVLALLNPGVLSLFWAGNTIKIAIPLAMLAACQTLTMLTGGIDLSVGTVATIAGFVTATLAPMTGVPPAIAIALACAVLVGLVNGFGVAVCVAICFTFCLGNSVAIGFGLCNDRTFTVGCAKHYAICNSIAISDSCSFCHTFSYRNSCGSATTNRIATSSNSGN